ncbi:MlaC/ttg2D family ABC transporter substrate-binding protein [Rhodovarius lipocyclicus]|jgi:phospholipid transport system substrate-binding protein|uniref:MlaC/ttg2D family ABC transporter substrate-binding protein n=1 Tax=Rhodovarius lipocyclicus TaxID=268410 RepID=UPI00135C939C|nr:ABC transporter substrate-binding protein [Rhodovarius lipocyclicus]
MIRVSRRILGGLVLLAPAAAVLPAIPPAWAQIDTNRASAFIQASGTELVGVINNPGIPADQRRQKVADILRRSVDIEGVARFVIGRFWRQASAQEQQEFLTLFEESLVRNLAGRFGEYQGVRFEMGRSQSRTDDDALVSTIVTRPGTAAFNLDWRVSDVNGAPRIVDLIAEGTSLRLTTRSEYSSVIQRGGGQVSSLITALKRQLGR